MKILRYKGKDGGLWRKFHNEEHRSLFSSPNIVRLSQGRGGCDM
jgi:hypothetical protein